MKGFFYRVLTVARHPKPAAQRSFRNAHARWTVFTSKPWEGRAKIVGFIGLKLVNYLFAAHLFFEYVGSVYPMDGPSMEPTFADHGECVIENRLSYKLRPDSIARGDIVTLRSPLDPFRIVCKRVIGLAGDVICVDPTGVLAPSTEHVIIPKGHVWLSGDNATMSRDSRQYGPVSTALIRGKLCARASLAFDQIQNLLQSDNIPRLSIRSIAAFFDQPHLNRTPHFIHDLHWPCPESRKHRYPIAYRESIILVVEEKTLLGKIHRVAPLPIRFEFEVVSGQPEVT